MQTPQEFLKRYFHERTSQTKREIEQRAGYRARYFTDDCDWDSRRDSVRRSESEEIIEVASAEHEATIVTRSTDPLQRLRYHLIRAGDKWFIDRVDIKVPIGEEWSTLQEMTEKLGAVLKPKTKEGSD